MPERRAATSAFPSTTAGACSAARRGPSRAGRSARGPEGRPRVPETGRSPSRRVSRPRPVVGPGARDRWRARPRARRASRSRITRRIEADPERLANSGVDVLLERHLGRVGEVVGEHAERLVRVDTAPPRLRDRRRPLRTAAPRCARAGGARSSRAARPARRGRRRLPPPQRARECCHRLRDGGETNDAARIAVRRGRRPSRSTTPAAANSTGQLVDLAKCLHARRY